MCKSNKKIIIFINTNKIVKQRILSKHQQIYEVLMPRFISNKMSESLLNTVDEISVVDVYDLASEIGKECEKIIEKYGTESVSTLIPKVINSLELLEALATRNESENLEMQELHDRIAQLENEKIEKAEYRKRFDKVKIDFPPQTVLCSEITII